MASSCAGFGLESSALEGVDQANTDCMSECRDRRPAAEFTSASRPPWSRLMSTSSSDFVTVEMRGLKAALVAHAKAKRVSVSVVVRRAVVRELGADAADASEPPLALDHPAATNRWIKVSMRVTPAEAGRLAAGERAAGLSRGAYLMGLVDGVPTLTSGGSWPEAVAALISSNAELSTLSRNVHQLAALLRQGNVQRALEYRAMLDCLALTVRSHLELAATVLAKLRTRRETDDVVGTTPTKGRRTCRGA